MLNNGESVETTLKAVQGSYVISRFRNYVSLKLFDSVKIKIVENYQNDILPVIEKTGLDLIINCKGLTSIKQPWLQALTLTEQALRKNNKSVRLILACQSIKALISEKGLTRVLQIKSNLRAALIDLGLVSTKLLDVGFVNPFLEATIYVLKKQSLIEATAGKIFLKKDTSKLFGDISGAIALVSESFNGHVIVTFPTQTFLNLMSKILQDNFVAINKEIADGASELTNMIFGHAKIILNEQGYGIKSAIPTLIIGRDHQVAANMKQLVVVVPFNSDSGIFYVEIYLADN